MKNKKDILWRTDGDIHDIPEGATVTFQFEGDNDAAVVVKFDGDELVVMPHCPKGQIHFLKEEKEENVCERIRFKNLGKVQEE